MIRSIQRCVRPVARWVMLAIAVDGCATVSVGPSPTAQPASATGACCTALERGVLAELNRARTDPERFAAELESRLPYYRGNIFRRPGTEVGVRTVEGASAVREAVRVLRATRPLAPLRLSRGMSAGAADHVRDQGPRGSMGHTGRDNSTPASRVSRYGRWFGIISENIQYGRAANAQDVIADLLIDDGVADRGHRHNALDPSIRVAGVSCGLHAAYGQMCVIVHAADYSERMSSEPGASPARR